MSSTCRHAVVDGWSREPRPAAQDREPFSGGLAQLVRAGVSYAPGPGFESLSRHQVGSRSKKWDRIADATALDETFVISGDCGAPGSLRFTGARDVCEYTVS